MHSFCYKILPFAGSEEASCHMVSCLERESNEGSLQLTVSKKQAFSPRAHKKLPTRHELRSKPFPCGASDKAEALADTLVTTLKFSA